jgi:hypothetical protein
VNSPIALRWRSGRAVLARRYEEDSADHPTHGASAGFGVANVSVARLGTTRCLGDLQAARKCEWKGTRVVKSLDSVLVELTAVQFDPELAQ